uniref:Uncharacterized protein n=1 Tax=Plectus sambesii TaxID=2011161 RepID=A0A914V3A2_9BILA
LRSWSGVSAKMHHLKNFLLLLLLAFLNLLVSPVASRPIRSLDDVWIDNQLMNQGSNFADFVAHPLWDSPPCLHFVNGCDGVM